MGITIAGINGESHMSTQEREYILSLLPEHGNVLEVGTFDGASCRAWAQDRPRCRFFCVDPFRSGGRTEPGHPDIWMSNQQVNMFLLIGTLPELQAILRPCLFAVAFIDGSHTEEHCLADLRSVRHLMAPAGTILVHDYRRWEDDSAVENAVGGFEQESPWKVSAVKHTIASLTWEVAQ